MEEDNNMKDRLNNLKKLLTPENTEEQRPIKPKGKQKKVKEKIEGLQQVNKSKQSPPVLPSTFTFEQSQFIELCIPMRFNITNICAEIGITRKTFYDWCNEKPEFNQAFEDTRMYIIDRAEDVLMQCLDDKDSKSAQFLLKHLSNKYKERVDITTNGQSIGTIINIIKPNE